jgi:hypothetical protein
MAGRFAFMLVFSYIGRMVVIIAQDSDGDDIGEPTTPETAEQITKLLKGRFNIQYQILQI